MPGLEKRQFFFHATLTGAGWVPESVIPHLISVNFAPQMDERYSLTSKRAVKTAECAAFSSRRDAWMCGQERGIPPSPQKQGTARNKAEWRILDRMGRNRHSLPQGVAGGKVPTQALEAKRLKRGAAFTPLQRPSFRGRKKVPGPHLLTRPRHILHDWRGFSLSHLMGEGRGEGALDHFVGYPTVP
jgi:hypothetical protein